MGWSLGWVGSEYVNNCSSLPRPDMNQDAGRQGGGDSPSAGVLPIHGYTFLPAMYESVEETRAQQHTKRGRMNDIKSFKKNFPMIQCCGSQMIYSGSGF